MKLYEKWSKWKSRDKISVKNMQKKKIIDKNIIKKISSINLDNSINLERALSYVEKIFENADNKSRLDQAESLRKKIRKIIRKLKQQYLMQQYLDI